MESTKRSVAKSFSWRLVATKEIARQALSGCSNSCSQPQLAEFGIISRKLIIEENCNQTPRFDLVHRDNQARRGETIQENLTLTEVHKLVDGLN